MKLRKRRFVGNSIESYLVADCGCVCSSDQVGTITLTSGGSGK